MQMETSYGNEQSAKSEVTEYADLFQAIPERVLDNIRKQFNSYSHQFLIQDETHNRHINLKRKHTGRVVTEIRSLGKSLGMKAEQLAFAETLAWLHDIGRFEQYKRYGTFSDAESEDHAQLGIRVIGELRILEALSATQKEIVIEAIRNHNSPEVPTGLSRVADFYSRLLRDADKLDIWRVSIEMNIFHKIRSEKLPDQYEVPDSLMDCFKDEKIILLNQVDSFHDSILFRVSWIYNLNFRYTYQQVQERKIVERLLAKLPESEKIEQVAQLTRAFIERQIDGY